MAVTARAYGGRSADERRAERRTRLIDAALVLWGEQGSGAVTVRGVCARAGLTDRYFYESFADRDVLLVAVYEQVEGDLLGILSASLPDLRATFGAFIQALVDDPRLARVAAIGPTDSAPLERRRRQTLVTVARMVTDITGQAHSPTNAWGDSHDGDPASTHADARADAHADARAAAQARDGADAHAGAQVDVRADAQAAAYFCAGGVGHLILSWLDGGLDLRPEQVVDQCTRLVAAAFKLS